MTRRIVVTGLGVVTPLSQNVDDLWKRILNSESGIHQLQVVDIDLFKIKIGGDIYDWDPSEIIP
ncbi:MAG: beta-ketoacyl synthase N-terminal-like domain-containing protein, partial [Pirellulales bacterium]